MPDTYYFERGDTRLSILSRMAKAQAKAVEEIWKTRSPDLPLKSPWEMVTLASIVEKETGKTDERPRVAGVFINRLDKHMRLGSDPTIVYGLVLGKGTLGRSITKADLNQPTPYNTYIIDGLPPGPICNPGKAALEAVAKPARSKDLYFVADGTGGHAFSETLDQHNKNVARWRQIEKDVKDKLAPDVTRARDSRFDRDGRSGAIWRTGRPRAGPGSRLDARSPRAKSARTGIPKMRRRLVAPGVKIDQGNERRRRWRQSFAVRNSCGGEPAGRDGDSGTCRLWSFLAAVWRARRAGAGTSVGFGSRPSQQDRRRSERQGRGARVPCRSGVKTIEEMGFVVIRRQRCAGGRRRVRRTTDPPGDRRPVGSAPLSPAMLADQKAREAKYGTADVGVDHARRHHRRRARSGVAGHRFRQSPHLRRLRRHCRSIPCSTRPTI